MNANLLPIILIANAFLAIGLVAFVNGIIFRKRLSMPLMIACICGGSFLAIGAAMIDVVVITMK